MPRHTPNAAKRIYLSADERETLFHCLASLSAEELAEEGHEDEIENLLRKVLN